VEDQHEAEQTATPTSVPGTGWMKLADGEVGMAEPATVGNVHECNWRR